MTASVNVRRLRPTIITIFTIITIITIYNNHYHFYNIVIIIIILIKNLTAKKSIHKKMFKNFFECLKVSIATFV